MRRRNKRLWVYRLVAAVLFPALVLVLLELGLRVVGFGYPTGFAVKRSVAGKKVYQPNAKFTWRFFTRALAREHTPFSIAAQKDRQTFRVFVLGGSAAQGVPDYSFSFSRVLEAQLRHRYPQKRFEIINAGITAINSHVVLEIARHCAKLDPDLFIVYLGNNEVVGPFGPGTVFSPFHSRLGMIRFNIAAQSTRTGQLLDRAAKLFSSPATPSQWTGMGMFADKQTRIDAPALQAVWSHFDQNLADICRVTRKRNIPVIFCTVAVNLKDSPPFASLHQPDLSDQQKRQWQQLYDQGAAFESQGDYAQAVQYYLKTAEIDDRYADLHFRLGRCYWQLQSYERARQSYVNARELDTLRFRADTRINDVIRSVAKKQSRGDVHLLDFAKIAGEQSPHGVTGRELLHEHVHLNFAGNYLLATSIVSQLDDQWSKWVKADAPTGAGLLSQQQCAEQLALTDWDRRRIVDRVLNDFVRHPPFTNQLYHQQRVAELERLLDEMVTTKADKTNAAYRRAIEQYEQDLWLAFNYHQYLFSAMQDYAAAEQQIRRFLQTYPDYARALENLGRTLFKQGKLDEAQVMYERALDVSPFDADLYVQRGRIAAARDQVDMAMSDWRRALHLRPDRYEAHFELGTVLASQGELEEAVSHLQQTTSIRPDYAAAHNDLGAVLQRLGRVDEAIVSFRQAVRVNPQFGTAHFNLGAGLIERGQFDADEVIAHFRAAIRARPDFAKAHYQLGTVLDEQGQHEAAADHYRQAIESDGDYVEARINLGVILGRQGQLEEAIKQFEKVLEIRPDLTRAHQNLATALRMLGRVDRAIRHFRLALDIDGHNLRSLNGLAHLLATHPDADSRQPDQAIELARHAADLTDYQNATILQTLAISYEAAGKVKQAQEIRQRLKQIKRNRPESESSPSSDAAGPRRWLIHS